MLSKEFYSKIKKGLNSSNIVSGITVEDLQRSFDNFITSQSISAVSFSWENLTEREIYSFEGSNVYVYADKTSDLPQDNDKKLEYLAKNALRALLDDLRREYRPSVISCFASLYMKFVETNGGLFEYVSFDLRDSPCLEDVTFLLSVPDELIQLLPKISYSIEFAEDKYQHSSVFENLHEYSQKINFSFKDVSSFFQKINRTSYDVYIDGHRRNLIRDLNSFLSFHRSVRNTVESNEIENGKLGFFTNGEKLEQFIYAEDSLIGQVSLSNVIALSLLFNHRLSNKFNSSDNRVKLLGKKFLLGDHKVEFRESQDSNVMKRGPEQFTTTSVAGKARKITNEVSPEKLWGMIKKRSNIDMKKNPLKVQPLDSLFSLCGSDASLEEVPYKKPLEKSKEDALIKAEQVSNTIQQAKPNEMFSGDPVLDPNQFKDLSGIADLESGFEKVLNRIDFRILLKKLLCCIAPEVGDKLNLNFDKFKGFSIKIPTVDISIPSLFGIISKIVRKLLKVALNAVIQAILSAIFSKLLKCNKQGEEPTTAPANDPRLGRPDPAEPIKSGISEQGEKSGISEQGEGFDNLIDDITSVLTTKELCDLIRGNPSEDILEMVSKIAGCSNSDNIKNKLKTKEDIRMFFESIGEDTYEEFVEFCQSDLGVPPDSINEFMCEISSLEQLEEDLRADLLGQKDLPQEQIREALKATKERREQEIKSIESLAKSDTPVADIVEKMSGKSMQEFSKSKIPAAKENENMKLMSKKTIKNSFDGVLKSYRRFFDNFEFQNEFFNFYVQMTLVDILNNLSNPQALPSNVKSKSVRKGSFGDIPDAALNSYVDAFNDQKRAEAIKNKTVTLKRSSRLSSFYSNSTFNAQGNKINISNGLDSVTFIDENNGSIEGRIGNQTSFQESDLNVDFNLKQRQKRLFENIREAEGSAKKNKTWIKEQLYEEMSGYIFRRIGSFLKNNIHFLNSKTKKFEPPIGDNLPLSYDTFRKLSEDDFIIDSWFNGKDLRDEIVDSFLEAEAESHKTRDEMKYSLLGGSSMLRIRLLFVKAFLQGLPISHLFGFLDYGVAQKKISNSLKENLKPLLGREEISFEDYLSKEKSNFISKVKKVLPSVVGDEMDFTYHLFKANTPIIDMLQGNITDLKGDRLDADIDFVISDEQEIRTENVTEKYPPDKTILKGYLQNGGFVFEKYIEYDLKEEKLESVPLENSSGKYPLQKWIMSVIRSDQIDGRIGEYFNSFSVGTRLSFISTNTKDIKSDQLITKVTKEISKGETKEFEVGVIPLAFNLREQPLEQSVRDFFLLDNPTSELVSNFKEDYREILVDIFPTKIFLMLLSIYTRKANDPKDKLLSETRQLLDKLIEGFEGVDDATSQYK